MSGNLFLVRVQCRRKESSRSLSHLLMSFLYSMQYTTICNSAHDKSLLADIWLGMQHAGISHFQFFCWAGVSLAAKKRLSARYPTKSVVHHSCGFYMGCFCDWYVLAAWEVSWKRNKWLRAAYVYRFYTQMTCLSLPSYWNFLFLFPRSSKNKLTHWDWKSWQETTAQILGFHER